TARTMQSRRSVCGHAIRLALALGNNDPSDFADSRKSPGDSRKSPKVAYVERAIRPDGHTAWKRQSRGHYASRPIRGHTHDATREELQDTQAAAGQKGDIHDRGESVPKDFRTAAFRANPIHMGGPGGPYTDARREADQFADVIIAVGPERHRCGNRLDGVSVNRQWRWKAGQSSDDRADASHLKQRIQTRVHHEFRTGDGENR